YLAIPHRKEVIYVYEEPVRKPVIVESPLAKRFKAEKTATGRVLKRARKEVGFIVEYEISSETSEVATIVRDEFYYPIASLSVIAPSVRMPLEREN
ncbi:MAG: IclR family transcriptional regulator, partial [Persephonella sp.]|nr:IclR family transcriptional regulator [Persephonella sp.]